MYTIGLTGGVGSGKSYIAVLAERNFHVLNINTDEIARNQMRKGGVSYIKVLYEFGKEILSSVGEIDRAKLAALVFSDDEKRKQLNELTHPAVSEYIHNLIQTETKKNEYTAVIIETAILKEAGYTDMCDEIWYVYASKEDRIERLLASRGYSLERIESMFDNQLSEDEYLKFADIIIDNHKGVSDNELVEQMKKSHYLANGGKKGYGRDETSGTDRIWT